MSDQRATRKSSRSVAIDERAIQTLTRQFQGELIRPNDAGYDQARAVWNGMIDRRPALIARCTSVADVVAAVSFARTNDLLVAVRGGAHNVAGFATCDGGIVIDLSPMKRIEVDPTNRIARAEGGTRWADLDAATQVYGLATPGGVVSDTGIAGLTLSGGYGWLRNKYGLTCDNLIAAEVVTADGRVLRASETEHPDLFWGLRGGGGNFGVVTTFEFQLHPVGPDVMGCFVFHDGARTVEALRFFREYTSTAPDEVAILAFCGTIPPGAEAFPQEIHGRRFVAFAGCYAGPVEEGARAIQPLRSFGEPLADFSGRTRYVDFQKMFDEDYPAHELRYYWKSLNLRELSDEAIAVIAEYATRQPSPLSTIDVWHLGSAIRRVPEDATAYSGRHVTYGLNPEANWSDPRDDVANVAWVRELLAAMESFADRGRYLNFPGFHEEGEATMRATFGAKYDRLTALKNTYDPSNLFRLNANVTPTV